MLAYRLSELNPYSTVPVQPWEILLLMGLALFCLLLFIMLIILIRQEYAMRQAHKKPFHAVLRAQSLPLLPLTSQPQQPTAVQQRPAKATLPVKAQASLTSAATDISNNWIITGASVIGAGHIKHNLPCQDAHTTELFARQHCGLAIVSDGAGSARYSEQGSRIAVATAHRIFKKILLKKGWLFNQHWPQANSWKKLAQQACRKVHQALEQEAHARKIKTADLACTLMVMIYSPDVLLVVHIGDGRAAYRDQQGKWHAALTPWKGEEANQTLFVSSDFWGQPLDAYIETRVIQGPVTGFALMSDGCEKHAFECSQLDPQTGQWQDPNQPYPGFFEPLANTLTRLGTQGYSQQAIQARWKQFLAQGTPGLQAESDDKTLIMGVWVA